MRLSIDELCRVKGEKSLFERRVMQEGSLRMVMEEIAVDVLLRD